jgi:hypothetical protein
LPIPERVYLADKALVINEKELIERSNRWELPEKRSFNNIYMSQFKGIDAS